MPWNQINSNWFCQQKLLNLYPFLQMNFLILSFQVIKNNIVVLFVHSFIHKIAEYQSKGSKEASSKGIVITLQSIEMNEASKEIRSQTSSYGSSRLLPTYQFLLNPKRQQNFQKFMENCQINYEVIGGMIHKTNLEIKNSINEELPKSLILSHNQQRQLERHFPPRCTSHAWTLGI